MNIKSNVMLLAEMAEIDNQIKHEAEVDVNTVMEAYNAVPECVGETVTEAADVVLRIDQEKKTIRYDTLAKR